MYSEIPKITQLPLERQKSQKNKAVKAIYF